MLSGQIQQCCGNDWLGMKAGETVLIPSNTIHQTKNVGGEKAVLMVAYSAGKRNYLASS